MKATLHSLLLAGALLALPGLLNAQSPMFTGHYVPGVEGIKGGSVPPPGFYIRDYNAFYTSSRLNAPGSSEAPVDFNAFVYANVIRGIWVSDAKVLGGNFFMDALIPLQYTSLKVNGWSDDNFGIGDIYVEPLALSWHGKQWDAALGYSVWMPTGDSDIGSAKPGKGFWGHMITAGGTYYFDEKKTAAFSVINRYEFNMENDDTDITPGQAWTIEWGLSKALKPTIELGLIGYYQVQTTDDSGPGASTVRDQVAAIGPEILMLCPKLGMFTSIRYNYEFYAEDRPQGHTIAVTFTKRF
jgi:hypothetical protein